MDMHSFMERFFPIILLPTYSAGTESGFAEASANAAIGIASVGLALAWTSALASAATSARASPVSAIAIFARSYSITPERTGSNIIHQPMGIAVAAVCHRNINVFAQYLVNQVALFGHLP
jgi:hypothetical protein